jgi:ribosomal protein S17E
LDPIATKEDFSRAICNMVVNGNAVLSKDFVENIDLVYATYQAKHMRNQLALHHYFMNRLSKLP